MTDEELLLAISEIVSKNSKVLEYRMETMEDSLNNKIDAVESRLNHRIDTVEEKLSNRIDAVEAKLSNRIDGVEARIDDVEKSLKADIHNINLKLENIIEPRIQHIEECYLSTFERYKLGVEKMDKMELDIEVIKSVVKKHEAILCAQSL